MRHACVSFTAIFIVITTADSISNVELLEKRIDRLENALKTCNTTGPGKRTSNISNPVIAFSAYLSGSITPVGIYEAFVYDHVTLNEGNAYNAHVGRFQAPVAGIYHFVATAQSQSSDSLKFELVKDRALLCRGEGTQSTGTCVSTVHLNANADVWVRHYSQYSNNGNTVYGDGYAVFTGHLIHAD